ncbi:MAG: cytochrome c [Methylococcaceae bacterium]
MKKLLLLIVFSSPCFSADISTGRQQQLHDLLKNDCGACHGLTLKGGMGPALLPENLAGKPDEFLINTILNGRKGTAMPPWNTFMNKDEAAWLVQQLKTTK